MSIIYKTTDVVDVKIGKLTVGLSPLTYKVKSDAQALLLKGKALDAAVMSLQHSIKKITGLKNADGSIYELNFNDNGVLNESHIDDLLNIPEQDKFTIIALDLLNGIPQEEFTDPQTGKSLNDVKIVKRKVQRKK